MALFKTRSAAIYGVDARLIDVEVDMYMGNPKDFITVGLPDTAVRESRERIKSSLVHTGVGFPNKAVTVNLAPANLRKEGAGFDLPMALGVMGAMGTIPVEGLEDYLIVGELSLDGGLRPVRGALPIAVCAKSEGIRNLILPMENAAEAAVVTGVNVFGFKHLRDVVSLIEQRDSPMPVREVSYLEGQPARASKLLPRVHRVVSLVKRWILGTHQGAVSHEHLDSYLDEFAFRFNRRKSRSRGKLFYRLVQQAVAVPPAPYKSLVGGTATRASDDHNM